MVNLSPKLNTTLMRAKTLRLTGTSHVLLEAIVTQEVLPLKSSDADRAVTTREFHSWQDILFLVDALYAPNLNAGYSVLFQYAKLDTQRNPDLHPRQLLAWEGPRDGSVSEDRILLHIQSRFYAGAETQCYFPIVNSQGRITRLESDETVRGSWVVGERSYTNAEGKTGLELAVILTPSTPLLISTLHPDTDWVEETLIVYQDGEVWVWSDRDSADLAHIDNLVLQLHADALSNA